MVEHFEESWSMEVLVCVCMVFCCKLFVYYQRIDEKTSHQGELLAWPAETHGKPKVSLLKEVFPIKPTDVIRKSTGFWCRHKRVCCEEQTEQGRNNHFKKIAPTMSCGVRNRTLALRIHEFAVAGWWIGSCGQMAVCLRNAISRTVW